MLGPLSYAALRTHGMIASSMGILAHLSMRKSSPWELGPYVLVCARVRFLRMGLVARKEART